MSVMHGNHDVREASTISLVVVAVILIVSAFGFTAMTAPITNLPGFSGGAVPAAFQVCSPFSTSSSARSGSTWAGAW
jgi:hypothetical protein